MLWCDLDKNNAAEIVPHHDFKNRNLSILKIGNGLQNNFFDEKENKYIGVPFPVSAWMVLHN